MNYLTDQLREIEQTLHGRPYRRSLFWTHPDDQTEAERLTAASQAARMTEPEIETDDDE